MKPLYNTSFKIFISLLPMLYLQKVLLIHLKKCVFYIIYELKFPSRVSFKSAFKSKAHVPPETILALGNNAGKIDTNLHAKCGPRCECYPTQTYSTMSVLVGVVNFAHVQIEEVCMCDLRSL